MGTIFCHRNSFSTCLAREIDFNMALFVMLALLALSSAALGKKEEQPACYPLQKGKDPCNQPLDICLILDSSGSIGSSNYQGILKVIANSFLPKFNINQKEVRVQLSIYSTRKGTPVHKVIFGLNKFNALKPMQAAVLGTEFIDGSTPTGFGMAEARKVFVKQMRKHVKKIKIVLTDGVASDTGRVFIEGKKWSDIARLKCLGVGIGPNIQLRQTCGASKNGRVYPGGANNIKVLKVKNINECERACEMTAFCKGFSFNKVNKDCALKKNMNGNGIPNKNFISRKCSPGVSEITQGNLKFVFKVDKFSDFGKFVDEQLVKETCGVIETDYMCKKCRAVAFTYWVKDPSTFIPVCDPEDNSYAAKQCHENKCWCVTKAGEKIEGSERTKGKPLNCKLIREKRKRTVVTECRKKAAKPGKFFKPACDAEGNFKPVQCVKGPKKNKYCWCSLRNGTPVPATIHRKNSPKKPDCLRHINLKYDCKEKLGNFKHPFATRRFISCVPGNAFACVCPGRTFFNTFTRGCAYTTKKPIKSLGIH